MRRIIIALVVAFLAIPGAAFALDKINVTLPSKSFQFIIFPLANERGYAREEGIEFNTVIMASATGLQAVVAGEMDFTGSGSSALVAVAQGGSGSGRRGLETLGEEGEGIVGGEPCGLPLHGGVDGGTVLVVCANARAQPAVGEQFQPQPRQAAARQQNAPVGAIALVLVAPGRLSCRPQEYADRLQTGVRAFDAGGDGRLQRGPLPLQR